MELLSLLEENNIDTDLLQKNLKNIGFDITRFEGVADEQLPLLMELFRTTLSIVPGKSSRNEKVALQVKLKNILKGLPVKTVEPVKEKTNKNQPIKKPNKTLGKVKFFDNKVNNFGFIVSLSDNIESRVNQTNLQTSPIVDNDIVLYKQIPIGNHKYRALKVTNKIPVFIFNKKEVARSFAIPLIDGFSDKEIPLTRLYPTGFFIATAKSTVSGWNILISSSETVPEEDCFSSGKNILIHFLQHTPTYTKAIKWLADFLQPILDKDTELKSLCIPAYLQELTEPKERARLIESLPPEQMIPLYLSYPDLAGFRRQYAGKILENEFTEKNIICFDIESDKETIKEYAWCGPDGTKSNSDFTNHKEGKAELIDHINSAGGVIGHNIKEFDLPILEEYGALSFPGFIWDTLEIEMLLNPQRFSYGLKTKHTALTDAELTYSLFKNQVARIIISQTLWEEVSDLLPEQFIKLLEQVRHNPCWQLLDSDYLNEQSDTFFRPTPEKQYLPEQTVRELTNKLEEEGQKIIIAPDFLWDTLSHYYDFTFYSDEHLLSFRLNEEKVDSNLADNPFLQMILNRFIKACSLEGKNPYLHHLPAVIQQKLTKEQIKEICDNTNSSSLYNPETTVCISPTDVESLEKHIPSSTGNLKVIVIGYELEQITSKLQLGQDLDFAFLFERLKNEPIWLQMSGGKSFIGLEQAHCRLLGVEEFPRFIQNIWLEKMGGGKLRLWCNQDFKAILNHLFPDDVYYIHWKEKPTIKTNSYLVRPDFKESGYIAEQKRVNPESFYRRSYWLYQFKLFEGIGSSDKPKVLILNDESESEHLSAYARKKGYYIPDTKASIARQLELLHENKSPNKLLITSFRVLDKIIACNYEGAIDYIWDSFSLHEKMQMLPKQELTDYTTDGEENDDDFQPNTNSVQKEYDLFSLIKRHRYMIDYYYTMLYKNNPSSRLFLCDSRLTDYFGIEKTLHLNTTSVKMWSHENEYEADKEFITKYIPSSYEEADTNFDIQEAKQILRHIFLMPEKGETPYEWYPYQHPCLDAILPAKKDLLISLPTGAGKSLLFQAPALFRSAFSSKLSIVITPLRALMQDQVEALWKKGFYSNVEYLSGDKSQAEIRDIYRRVAGGEITLLFITPERFRSRSFENSFLSRLDEDNGLEYVVFDEAHCISQWGQEFRPDYLNAGKKVAEYSGRYPMCKLLFSATISEQVFEEISILMPGITTVEGTEKIYNPVRDHIQMSFKHDVEMDRRLEEVATYLKDGGFNPSLSRAIIFVKSRKRVEECAMVMTDTMKEVFGENCDFADKIGGFHAGMDAEDRKDTYEKYKTGEIVILFATKAFGMGMDIPDIHFIVHYSPPGTFEDFLQEIGRAGRNENLRLKAGFNNDKPIQTLCLTGKADFARLKDQLHNSRISWHEVKEVQTVVENYIARIKPLETDTELAVAVPFNLYSVENLLVDDELDNKFRIGLYWLERLERIKLGYFTITHIEFDYKSLIHLESKISEYPDDNCRKACRAIIELMPKGSLPNPVLQLSIASLRSLSKLSLDKLFAALLKCHSLEIFKLNQNVIIEPTKLRREEVNYCREISDSKKKYPALRVLFSFVSKIMESVPLTDSKLFEGDELDEFLQESITEIIDYDKLPWEKKGDEKSQLKKYESYINDILRKRSKHAFTIIRLLSKARYESTMEKVTDSNRQIRIRQSIFNGYHKKLEWKDELNLLEKNCIDLLDYVSKPYFKDNRKKFNWPDLVSELNLKGNIQYLSNLFFILSVLGYNRVSGLLPAGIEVYLTSLEPIDETNEALNDKAIYEEFLEVQQIRELKQISLQLLSNLDRNEQDAFIKGFFAAKTKLELINHLQDKGQIDDDHPIFKAFRGEAIKYQEEKRLNEEQKVIYDADIKQHINVMAGPGSGKTHTLTLRVAKLVYYKHANPEEILVLAYNRAVVSELKDRLGKLFRELGFGNLSNRIKIYTFHGLAKKYAQEQLTDLPFNEWEPTLLKILQKSPGSIMNQLSPLKHILVDEFQDINEVRMDILNKLTEITQAFLFIIGDPNQSIYGYDRDYMDPYHYYEDFNERFTPKKFQLIRNHRSYPDVLDIAGKVLPENQEILPLKPTKFPDDTYLEEYVEVYDFLNTNTKWWEKLPILLSEKIQQSSEEAPKPYRQIAILFRTNNEVYRGFQKIQSMKFPNIRIRIQGSLPYEFTRIRECYAIIELLKQHTGHPIQPNFKTEFNSKIKDLIDKNPNWNHFYLHVVQALVLEYLDEQDEVQTYDKLLEFIEEISYKDDGQLYKVYEKYLNELGITTRETEIVLTTMHKVKGLEFDCVVIPPSFSNLPLAGNDNELQEQLDEEKRLAFVSYTRAKYRLLIFRRERESALLNNQPYNIPDDENRLLGIPMQVGIDKLNIGWAANSYNFNRGINNYIQNTIKSGDSLVIKKKDITYNGSNFSVYELYKENTSTAIGVLAAETALDLGIHQEISGFVVNEVVTWSYEETCKSDEKNNTSYATKWCPEAKEQGYIYLVDFAGFGRGITELT